jgi:hypothetical protein
MKLLNASTENSTAEKTIQLTDLKSIISEKNNNSSSNSKQNGESGNNLDLVESACKLLIEQVLKQCPNANLASITIKTSSVPAEKSSSTNSPQQSSAQLEPKTTFTTIQLSDLKNSGRNLSDELKNSNLNLSTLATTSISSSVTTTPIGGAAVTYPLTVMNNQVVGLKSKQQSPSSDEASNSILKKMRLTGFDDNEANASTHEHLSKKANNQPTVSFKPGPTLATGRRSKDTEVGFLIFLWFDFVNIKHESKH